MCLTDAEALEQSKRAIPYLWELVREGKYAEAPRRTLRACLKRIAFFND